MTTEHNEAPSTAQPQGVSQISDPIPAGTESGNIHEDEYGDDEEVTDVDGYRPDSEPFKNKVNVRMPDMGDSDGTYPKTRESSSLFEVQFSCLIYLSTSHW